MNSNSSPILRVATSSDVQAMSDIYAYHVLNGTGSFEELPPDIEEIRQRWVQREAEHYPTLVAELHGEVAGFSYASSYKARSAYRFTVEDSVYIAPGYVGQGIGRRLLQELIEVCTVAEFCQMMAVIGDSSNRASIRLHESCGFRAVGIAHGLGLKHGKWLDVVYMQRELHRPAPV